MFSTFWTIISIGAVVLVALWIVAAFLSKKFKGLVELFNELKAAIQVIHDAVQKKDTGTTTPPATPPTGDTTGGGGVPSTGKTPQQA